MKNAYLIFLATLFLFASCGKDDDNAVLAELRHDGVNFNAPFLEIGGHKLASRYSANELATHQGKTLDKIEFYLLDVPPTCEAVVYEGGTAAEPGTEVYRKAITSMNANSWNIHTLSDPIEIGTEDLWITIEISLTSSIRSVGCDAGPAVIDGDWISSDFSPSWKTFRNHSANVSDINWNIRGDLSD